MRRTWLFGLVLLAIPAPTVAQVEIGMDAGLQVSMFDSNGNDENVTTISIPAGHLRFGFPVGERLRFEPLVALQRLSADDASITSLSLVPGVAFLFSEAGQPQFYVRGEAGLSRTSVSDAGDDDSVTQYGVGGGVGVRIPAGDNAIFRLEGGFNSWFENTDEGIPSENRLRFLVGVSAIIN